MSLRQLTTIAVLAFIVILSAFVAVSSAGAAVYPQSPFTYDGFGGHYEGSCTTNITSSHFINACHATLTAGSPVSQTTKLDGPNLNGVISPSGQMTEIVNLGL